MGAVPKPAEAQHLEDAYERFKEPLLQKARIWFPTLRGMELDLYQSAWEGLLRNGEVEDLGLYLERSVFNKGLDELRRRGRRPAISLERLHMRRPGTRRLSQGVSGTESVADARTPLPEDRVQLQQEAKLALELLDELTPLQQKIVKLRWGWRVPRKQAARMLGISERALRKQIEDAATVITKNAQLVEQGRWCERKRSLILAYSFEFLSPGRVAKAEQHLDACPACRQVVLELRRRIAGVGAMAPLPPCLPQPLGLDLVARLGELLSSARDVLSDMPSLVKHHVVGLFARTPAAEAATTQLAASGGIRGSGGVIAAVTACLVAGGSAATYCTLEGVPAPLRDLAQVERKQEQGSEREGRRPAETEAQTPVPIDTQTVSQGSEDQGAKSGAPNGQRATSSLPDLSPQAAAPSPAPEGSSEFEPGPATAAQSRPAAAPASGGGEFTP